MDELKPCPFCGGKAEISQLGDRRKSTVYSCLECGCKLETNEEFSHGKDWNGRVFKEFKTETRYLPACYTDKKISLKKFPRDKNKESSVEWYCSTYCEKVKACKLDKKPVKATITYKIEMNECSNKQN